MIANVKSKEDEYSDLEVYRRLLAIARPHWWSVASCFFVSLLGTPLGLLQPFPLKLVVDSVIGSQPAPRLLATVLPSAAVESRWSLLVVAVVLLLVITIVSRLQELGGWLAWAAGSPWLHFPPWMTYVSSSLVVVEIGRAHV